MSQMTLTDNNHTWCMVGLIVAGILLGVPSVSHSNPTDSLAENGN